MTALMTRIYGNALVEPADEAVAPLSVSGVSTGGIWLYSVSSSAPCAMTSDFDGYELFFVRSGDMAVRSRKTELSVGPAEGAIIDWSERPQKRMSGGFVADAVSLPANELKTALSGLLGAPVPGRVEFRSARPTDPTSYELLRALADVLRRGLAGDAPLGRSPVTLANLRHSLISLVLESFEHNFSQALRSESALPSPRHVKRAIEFMSANIARPISLEDIAAAAGASVRSVQMGFKRFRGTSPIAYLRHMRLEAARRMLSDPQCTLSVAEVAYRWGFNHLGNFASAYEEAYGELPSTTVRGGPVRKAAKSGATGRSHALRALTAGA